MDKLCDYRCWVDSLRAPNAAKGIKCYTIQKRLQKKTVKAFFFFYHSTKVAFRLIHFSHLQAVKFSSPYGAIWHDYCYTPFLNMSKVQDMKALKVQHSSTFKVVLSSTMGPCLGDSHSWVRELAVWSNICCHSNKTYIITFNIARLCRSLLCRFGDKNLVWSQQASERYKLKSG